MCFIVKSRRYVGLGRGGIFAVTLSCILQQPTTRADTVPAENATPQKREEIVVTASRRDLIGSAQTASQGSVTQEELQLRPVYRVGQLLESVPGRCQTKPF